MVVISCLLVSATTSAGAAVAGATTAFEVLSKKSVLETLGLVKGIDPPLLVQSGQSVRCFVWNGSRWNSCNVSLRGDVLLVSGRTPIGQEALMLSSALVSVTEDFVTVVCKAGNPLNLRFNQANQAADFGFKVQSAAALTQDIDAIADSVADRRCQVFDRSRSAPALRSQPFHQDSRAIEVRSIGVGSTPGLQSLENTPRGVMSGSRSLHNLPPRPSESSLATRTALASVSEMRRELSVPPEVPLYSLSPAPSVTNFNAPNIRRNEESGESLADQLKALSLRPPGEFERLPETPPDENSFASKVFQALGLSPAKAKLKAQTRVQALRARFQDPTAMATSAG